MLVLLPVRDRVCLGSGAREVPRATSESERNVHCSPRGTTRPASTAARGGVETGHLMALLAAGGQADAASVPSRVTLPSPNPANLAGTSKPLDVAQVLNLRVYLADRPGLAPRATAVSDPGSPGYGHYLTPHEFQRLFGPTAGHVTAVHDWLTGQGAPSNSLPTTPR